MSAAKLIVFRRGQGSPTIVTVEEADGRRALSEFNSQRVGQRPMTVVEFTSVPNPDGMRSTWSLATQDVDMLGLEYQGVAVMSTSGRVLS